MQKKRKIFAFLSLLALIVIHSCSSSDTSPPIVSITDPSENQIVDAGDTIPVRAQITDDQKITYWEVRLTDENFAPLGETFSASPDSKTANVNLLYPIPSGLENGTYYIRVRADDEESTANQYVKLNINEVAQERLGLIAIVESAGNYQAKYWLNGGSWVLLADLGTDFSGAGFSSATDQLVTGNIADLLSVYDLVSGQLAYTQNCIAAPGFPCITAIGNDGQFNYMGMEEGRLRRYSASGALSLDAALMEFRIPQSLYFQNDRIFIYETQRAGSSSFWTSYNINNGISIQEVLLPGVPVAAFEQGPNTTMMFLNDQGVGSIRRYQFSTNGFEAALPGPNGVINSAASKNANTYFFSQPDGIYSLDYSTSNTLMFKAGVSPDVMVYDNIGDELIVGEGVFIRAYDSGSGTLNYSTLPGGQVIKLFVWYSD